MSPEIILIIGVIILLMLFSLLKAEKLIKITFGSYLMIGIVLNLGIFLLQSANLLLESAQNSLFGLNYQQYAHLIHNAQPTIMLAIYGFGLRFFAQNSSITIKLGVTLFEQKLQTFLRCLLCVGSILTSLYLILNYFKGALYERIFSQDLIIRYVSGLPVLGVICAIMVLFASSQLKFRLLKRKETGEGGLLSS